MQVGDVNCGTEFSGKFPTILKAHLKKNHPSAFQELLAKEGEKELAKKIQGSPFKSLLQRGM